MNSMRTFDINPIFGENLSIIGEERIYKRTCKCKVRVCTSTRIEVVYYNVPYKNLGMWLRKCPVTFKQALERKRKYNTCPTIKKQCKQFL